MSKKSDELTPQERRELRERCTRSLTGHGLRTPAAMLAEMATLGDDLAADVYGDGGTVATLEEEVRTLLGKPAAVFMPSGTMAQQIALRIHADRRATRVVAFHPTCHLEIHEDKAYERLHHLVGRPVGDPQALITLADLRKIPEPIAALLIELPQREIGGLLPAWKDLVAQVEWAHGRGTAVHLDGARLWESAPFYRRDVAQIASLFDSVYVSFYKGLGGTAGSMLLGEEDFIAEAREWRHRHGGTIFNLWPYAASALAGLRLRLPRMKSYVAHAREIASALSAINGVEVVPDPPHTNMMRVHLRTTPAAVDAGIRRLAREQRLWVTGGSFPSDTPGYRRFEIHVGDAALALSPTEAAQAVRALMSA
ncbi:MAG: beta-eliminating lyase-related protein [Candidatus Limnocylindrales bacterium]